MATMVKCLECGDLLDPLKYGFRGCTCKAVYVDGNPHGHYRVVGMFEDWQHEMQEEL